ncbi:MAG: hypothetical protein NUV52_03365 [Candidatus Roizmanbacteria bacterium]|nr:hypothetical protein [Candidatus Roizmanbacteria bacterium]
MLHQFDGQPSNNNRMSSRSNNLPLIIAVILALVLGTTTGYIVKTRFANAVPMMQNSDGTGGAASQALGTKNTKLFPDDATGIVRKGGVDDEGTHHLERKGGPSQNVYLTSSSVDLTKLVGKTVTVWGKTYAAEKAGWLMDVGYVEVQ